MVKETAITLTSADAEPPLWSVVQDSQREVWVRYFDGWSSAGYIGRTHRWENLFAGPEDQVTLLSNVTAYRRQEAAQHPDTWRVGGSGGTNGHIIYRGTEIQAMALRPETAEWLVGVANSTVKPPIDVQVDPHEQARQLMADALAMLAGQPEPDQG